MSRQKLNIKIFSDFSRQKKNIDNGRIIAVFGVCWSPLKKKAGTSFYSCTVAFLPLIICMSMIFCYKLDIFKKLAVILVWTAIYFSIEVKERSF